MACLICDAQLFRVELALFLQRLHQCFWCGVFGFSEGLQSHCCVSTQWQSQSRCSRFGGNVRVPLLCLNTVAFSSFFGSMQLACVLSDHVAWCWVRYLHLSIKSAQLCLNTVAFPPSIEDNFRSSLVHTQAQSSLVASASECFIPNPESVWYLWKQASLTQPMSELEYVPNLPVLCLSQCSLQLNCWEGGANNCQG